jgi:hypothetical protein
VGKKLIDPELHAGRRVHERGDRVSSKRGDSGDLSIRREVNKYLDRCELKRIKVMVTGLRPVLIIPLH